MSEQTCFYETLIILQDGNLKLDLRPLDESYNFVCMSLLQEEHTQ